jgi:glycosyltransferase involved in cell wall biosynthesis
MTTAGPDVLLVIDSFELGGTETFATRAIEGLRAEGLSVHVACLRAQGPLLERARNAASGFHVVAASSGPLRIAGLVAALRRLVERLSPRCVYAQDVYSNYLSAIALLGRPWMRLITSRRWARTPSMARRIVANWAARRADAVVVNAEWLAATVAAEGVRRERIHLVPNIVDAAMFEPASDAERAAWREALDMPRDAFVVMVAGRLHPDKGPDIALEAMTLLPDSLEPVPWLVLMGDGEMRASLEERARTLTPAVRIRFGGAYRTPPNVFRYCDLALLPSRTEGMPNALIEAAAAARACIAADVGGVRQLANLFGDAVKVFVAEDPVALASTLAPAIRRTEAVRCAALEAQEEVRLRHAPRAVARQLESLICA